MDNWKDTALEMWESGKSWETIAAAIRDQFFPEEDKGKVKERVRTFIRRTPGYKKQKLNFQDKRETTPQDIEAYWTALKGLNTAIDAMDKKQTSADVHIEEDKPVCIVFWGDWHVGARGVDYAKLESDKDIIRDTDGMYFIGLGDYKDNANPFVHADSVRQSLVPTDAQDMLVGDIVEDVSEKAIALVRGCHDDWSNKMDGVDFVQNLCNRAGCLNMWHGGVLNVKVGNTDYKIGARHKYKWESGLNTTNTQRNFINEFGFFDIVCFAHKHFPDMQQTNRMGRPTVYMRTGSYKSYDEFGQKIGGYSGNSGIACAILFPNKKLMIPVIGLETARDILKSYRESGE